MVAYPEAASFVKFLIDEYGKERFLRAFKTLKSSQEDAIRRKNVTALERIYDMPLVDMKKQWHEHLAAADTTSTPKKTGDSRTETPEEAVTKAFKKIQDSLRDVKYETTWNLTAENMRSEMDQNDFQKFKARMSSDEIKRMFANLRPGAVTAEKIPEIGNVLVIQVEDDQQAWKFAFIKEDGQWKICEGKRK